MTTVTNGKIYVVYVWKHGPIVGMSYDTYYDDGEKVEFLPEPGTYSEVTPQIGELMAGHIQRDMDPFGMFLCGNGIADRDPDRIHVFDSLLDHPDLDKLYW